MSTTVTDVRQSAKKQFEKTRQTVADAGNQRRVCNAVPQVATAQSIALPNVPTPKQQATACQHCMHYHVTKIDRSTDATARQALTTMQEQHRFRTVINVLQKELLHV